MTACRKAVEVAPPITSLVSANVFQNNTTASAAVTGIYSDMVSYTSFLGGGNIGVSCIMGLSADELQYYGTTSLWEQIYQNAQLSTNPPAIWTPLYNYIYQANSAIEGLSSSTGVTTALRQQLVGEAKFIRAFCLFYLVNVYGNVPLATTTNYQVNNTLSRAPAAKVYEQIVSDLKDAQDSLSINFLDPSGNVTPERVRPNSAAATALLARAYLYMGDWVDAEAQATTVLGQTGTYGLSENLDSTFLMNSEEAIWQLQAITPNYNTLDGYFFILNAAPGNGLNSVALNADLLGSFEIGDLRRAHWVDSVNVTSGTFYFPYKYKVGQSFTVTEYTMVLRFAEQYLIRAEARANQGNVTGAMDDINVLRNRAGLTALSNSLSQPQALAAIAHERQVELFTEWGHRWFDLRRTNSIDQTMDTVCPQKGGTWNTSAQLFPIPLTEIQANGNLVQNQGYQ